MQGWVKACKCCFQSMDNRWRWALKLETLYKYSWKHQTSNIKYSYYIYQLPTIFPMLLWSCWLCFSGLHLHTKNNCSVSPIQDNHYMCPIEDFSPIPVVLTFKKWTKRILSQLRLTPPLTRDQGRLEQSQRRLTASLTRLQGRLVRLPKWVFMTWRLIHKTSYLFLRLLGQSLMIQMAFPFFQGRGLVLKVNDSLSILVSFLDETYDHEWNVSQKVSPLYPEEWVPWSPQGLDGVPLLSGKRPGLENRRQSHNPRFLPWWDL